MNLLTAFLRNTGCALLAAASLCGTSSCDSAIYDSEGDCSVSYLLSFRYDLNIKWADAFAHEVGSVRLFAFGDDGKLVWQKSEKGAALAEEGYKMKLDLPAGKYSLLAWCGLDTEEGDNRSFTVPEATVGVTHIEELQCSLNRERHEAGARSAERLRPLFHGMMNVELPDASDVGGEFNYTMPLTKNTNHIRVILQHISGGDVDVNKFTFLIEDANGLLAHDNAPLPDESITYMPWKKQSSEAGFGHEGEAGTISVFKGAVADFTVGRMLDTRRMDMVLTITNDRNETVARIPVIDYALLAKDYYEDEYGHKMSDQEFLDREDDFVMTFFLDEGNRWIDSYIYINSWRVVLQNVGLE